MPPALRRTFAIGLYALTLVSFITALLVFTLGGSGSVDSLEGLALAPIPLVFGTVGLFLSWRVSHNRTGWVFLTGGTLFALYLLAYSYSYWGVVEDWPAVWVAALANYVLYMPAILSLTALPLLLFPTGFLPSPRWRWVLWTLVIFITFNIVGLTLSPTLPTEELGLRSQDEIAAQYVAIEAGQPVVQVDNPLGVEGIRDWGPTLSPLFMALLAASFLGPAASMVYRLRRAQGEERLQIKWLGLSALIAALGLGSFYLIQDTAPEAPVLGPLLGVGLIGVLCIPVAAGIAITRYRLYEIDRLMSRTIAYSVIVGMLGTLFAAGVVWIPTALGLEDSPLLIASTTLVVAALFNPLRTRIQRAVDRRFNRSRFLSQQVAQQFATDLQAMHGTDQIVDMWLSTVSESVEPEAAGIWIADFGARRD